MPAHFQTNLSHKFQGIMPTLHVTQIQRPGKICMDLRHYPADPAKGLTPEATLIPEEYFLVICCFFKLFIRLNNFNSP